MRNVIVCWVYNVSSFEDWVPLCFMGERNLKMGFKNDFDILFLEGYELLPENYKSYLKGLGFSLHDVNHQYSDFNRNYKTLNRFTDYEKKCFLRWLVIQQYFTGEGIMHYDGDVLFNEDPGVLQRGLKGMTFVLQGCPALTCISDPAWFFDYQKQFAYFASDIERYSKDAWVKRDGWEKSEREKWAGSRFRHIISHDQDLISHLIHTDQIIQNKPEEVLGIMRFHIFFDNPLYIHNCYSNDKELPFKYEREDGIDYLNGKRVAFWHMQGNFSHYLYKFLHRKEYFKFLFHSKLKNSLEKRDLEHYLSSVIVRFSKHNYNLRLRVYKYFFEENNFGEVFSDKIWWKKGVFV